MAMISISRPHFGGLVFPIIGAIHPEIRSHHIQCQNWGQSHSRTGVQGTLGRVTFQSRIGQVQHILRKKYTPIAGGNHHHLTIEDDYDQEPFWSNVAKEAFWAVKSLLVFLVEQPSQLKHIEWPSIQITLKTATLSLVLVGMLIVALASVDSALCYILSLLLSRRA